MSNLLNYEVQYWVHHESNCIWKTNTEKDALDAVSDPNVEEIDIAMYYLLRADGYNDQCPNGRGGRYGKRRGYTKTTVIR